MSVRTAFSACMSRNIAQGSSHEPALIAPTSFIDATFSNGRAIRQPVHHLRLSCMFHKGAKRHAVTTPICLVCFAWDPTNCSRRQPARAAFLHDCHSMRTIWQPVLLLDLVRGAAESVSQHDCSHRGSRRGWLRRSLLFAGMQHRVLITVFDLLASQRAWVSHRNMAAQRIAARKAGPLHSTV